MAKEIIKYARKCDNCGKGMNEGHCWGDGEGYACSNECLYVDGYTKKQHDIDYEDGTIYWTDWYEVLDEEDEYYTESGELIEV